jgi:uncharacterized SAM-binding protein YcdF (DUF218 family)
MGEVYLLLTFISMSDPRSFLVVSTLLGQIENAENFTKMKVKHYTRIIHSKIKKELPQRCPYLSIMCMSMNYNRLLKSFYKRANPK